MSTNLQDLNPATPVCRLWQRRDLLWQFTKRNVQTGFRGSYLGVFWVVLSPLMMLALYTFVFGVVFGGNFEQAGADGEVVRKEGAGYALGIFLGLSMLNLFSGTLSSCSTLVVANPNFVKKVVFPLEVLPVAQVGNLAFNYCICLVLCLLGALFFGGGVNGTWLWIPVIMVPVILASLGVGWLLSSLGVFFRDLAQLTQFLGMVLLYASGVFYSVSKIPPGYWSVLKWNPLLHAVDQLRQVVLWQTAPVGERVLYIWVSSLVIFQVGYWVFQRLRMDFADVL